MKAYHPHFLYSPHFIVQMQDKVTNEANGTREVFVVFIAVFSVGARKFQSLGVQF